MSGRLFRTRSGEEGRRLLQPPAIYREGYFDVRRLWAAVRRQMPLSVLGAAIGVTLGVMVIVASPPMYLAVETVLLDEERADLLNQVSALPSASWTDTAVQSEVEIIKSQTLALSVVDMLDLASDDEFLSPPSSPFARVRSALKGAVVPLLTLITPAPDASLSAEGPETDEAVSIEEQRRQAAAGILRDHLDVSRAGRGLVLTITYTGYRPERVTRIARAYGEAYKNFQVLSQAEVAADAVEWLEERLERLEERSKEAAAAVQEYRVANELVSVKGDLLSGEQLSGMTSELIRAEADVAQARARRDALRALLAQGAGEATAGIALVADTSSAEILQELRIKLFDLQSRRGELAVRQGADHPEVQRLDERIGAVHRQMFEELQRAEKGLAALFGVARSRERSLRENFDAVTSARLGEGASIRRLQQLEETAETYSQVYRDFLKRYEQAAHHGTLPIASVNIISRAEEPKAPFSPNKSAILAMGLILGGMAGAGLGVVRELREQPLRTRRDVQETLGIVCLGLLPGARQRSQSAADTVRRRTLDAALNAITAAGRRAPCVVIGVASLPHASRHILASEIAASFAEHGSRVLLLDASRPATAESSEGAADVEQTEQGIDRIEFGPSDPQLDSDSVSELLQRFGGRYDHLIIAFPALGESLQPEICAPALHATVLAIRWNVTLPRVVRGALEDNNEFADRLAGAVLIDADLRRARRYVERDSYEAQLLRTRG